MSDKLISEFVRLRSSLPVVEGMAEDKRQAIEDREIEVDFEAIEKRLQAEKERLERDELRKRFQNLRAYESQVGIFKEKRLANYEAFTPRQEAVKEALLECCENANNFKTNPYNLLLFGPVGTGKDHLICAVGRVLVKSGVRVRYVLADDFFQHASDRYSTNQTERSFFNEYKSPEVLIISDPVRKKWLPVESDSRFKDAGFEKLTSVIKQRYSIGRPVWIAGNLPGRNEQDAYKMAGQLFGMDVWSRLVDGAKRFWCDWGCYRKAATR